MTKKLLQEPLVHFLLIGAALFAVSHLTGLRSGNGPEQIVVTPGQIELLEAGFARTWQRPPSEEELGGLIEDYVREEVSYREAIALGLDRDDTVIRRRLAIRYEFLANDLAGLDQTNPTDEELRLYMQAHPESFRTDPELSFRQVCFNVHERGEQAIQEAREALELLTANPAADATAVGDLTMLPGDVPRATRLDVARQFGDEFVRQILQMELGRWEGPVKSGYGLHLVQLREYDPARLPELAEVREAVRRAWLDARRKDQIEAAYRKLREGYVVVVQPPSGGAPGRATTAEAAR